MIRSNEPPLGEALDLNITPEVSGAADPSPALPVEATQQENKVRRRLRRTACLRDQNIAAPTATYCAPIRGAC
jgi:hypothetical protein